MADGMPRRGAGEMVHLMLEITGNSLEPITFNLRRGVVALDESPNPELSYSVEVIAEGDEAITARYLTAGDRVYAVLPDPRRTLSRSRSSVTDWWPTTPARGR